MMPMRVIGMLLGIPESDQIMVRDANDANLRTKPGTPMKVAKADKIADGRIYADYVEWRSKNPSDDLMTALLNVEFEDETGVTRKLHRKEVLHYTQVVAGAGNETTGRLIGWLAKVLAEHPDQRREVDEDRSLLNRAVDETLRFEPTGPHVARYIAPGFRVLRHNGARGQRDAAALRRGQSRPAPLRATPTRSTSTATRQPPDVRQGSALLPRRQPRPARGPGRARRAAQPLAGVGDRLRHRADRADVDRSRAGRSCESSWLTRAPVGLKRSEFGARNEHVKVTSSGNRRGCLRSDSR